MDDPKICPYCDLSAKEYCIQCDKCQKWIHYACSNLPVYTVIQLHKSSRLFSCSSCVHQRFIDTYTGLYDKFTKIIQAQNTTMNRLPGNITDDIHVDVDTANTSQAPSLTEDNQEAALILSPLPVHNHIVSPPSPHPSPPPNYHLPLMKPSQPPSVNSNLYLPPAPSP